MRKAFSIVALMVGSLWGNAVLCADADAGRKISQSKGCIGCHGVNGISAPGTSYPNLAGQKAPYLEKALKAYRDKTRQAPLMNGMAAGLSEGDIADLAAFYSSLKPCP
ncbi:cytochrome c [Methylomarinovum tepidoasis]|uniref:Cytochrome c n=1 Tax=Methylomarinovum tepidoasis TaxID=2840183 RepID=A0AAU9CJB6_9GAMM|nr:cytochrome c [Methylomarinovum sp. IN45]BCX87712.1 cytochrome c [Methylomarinovum sp. IN45]